MNTVPFCICEVHGATCMLSLKIEQQCAHVYSDRWCQFHQLEFVISDQSSDRWMEFRIVTTLVYREAFRVSVLALHCQSLVHLNYWLLATLVLDAHKA